jgi:Leucine-rich repeat (LRR) protein
MNIPKLKMLYVNRNKLKEIDIDVLTKFNNLEKVNFDLNSIDDIDNIEKIKYLKQLKLFSIKNNKLDNKDKKILEDIKKENEKLKIEL